jgi:hypothetical protein
MSAAAAGRLVRNPSPYQEHAQQKTGNPKRFNAHACQLAGVLDLNLFWRCLQTVVHLPAVDLQSTRSP